MTVTMTEAENSPPENRTEKRPVITIYTRLTPGVIYVWLDLHGRRYLNRYLLYVFAYGLCYANFRAKVSCVANSTDISVPAGSAVRIVLLFD